MTGHIIAHIALREKKNKKSKIKDQFQIFSSSNEWKEDRKGAPIYVMMYLFELTSLNFCQNHSSIKVTDGNIPGHLINITIIPLDRRQNK